MIPDIMQLLGLLPGPTVITLFLALWVSGTLGWLACYSIIGGYWMKNKKLVKNAKIFQQVFEALARSFLFVYMFSIALVMGGLEGIAVIVLAFILVVQSVLNIRHFLLFSMGLMLLITYLVLLSSIYNWLHVSFL